MAQALTLDVIVHNPAVMADARERDDAYLDALVKEVLRIRCSKRSRVEPAAYDPPSGEG